MMGFVMFGILFGMVHYKERTKKWLRIFRLGVIRAIFFLLVGYVMAHQRPAGFLYYILLLLFLAGGEISWRVLQFAENILQ